MTRPLLALAALTFAAPAAVGQAHPADFAEYWAAARVYAAGGNPYDGAQLLPLQRELLGEPDRAEAVMLWTPPWTLPLYAPLGVLAPEAAGSAWAAAQAALLLLSAAALAAACGRGRRWALAVPLGVLLTSAEARWLFEYQQNSGFVLFGLAGFLYCRTRGYPFAAGLVGALTAVKPHLLLPFAAVLLVEARSRDGRRVLLGGVAALALGSLLALLPNRHIFADFLDALRAPSTAAAVSVKDWKLPLLSYHFRQTVDPGRFAWQFLPAAAASAGYAVVRWRSRDWDWRERLPLVVLVSLLCAPYGAWVFDLVLLALPAAAMLFRALATGRAVVVLAAVALHLLRYRPAARIDWLDDAWAVTPVAVAGWLAVAALARRPASGTA